MTAALRGIGRPRCWMQIAAVLLGLVPGPVLGRAETPVPATNPDCQRALAAGAEFLRQERYQDARESFGEAVRSCPHEAAAWRGLGQAGLALGAAPSAAAAYRRALALAPTDLGLLQSLADAEAAQAGRNLAAADSALWLYDAVLRNDPARAAAYGAAAEVCARRSDLPGAITLEMQQRVATGAGAGDSWSAALGRELLNAKVYSEAARVYRACVARDSTDQESRRVLAYLDYRLGRWQEAARAYEVILRHEPEGSTAARERETLAECLTHLGRWKEAAEAWSRLAAVEPERERYRCEEAGAWLRAGRAGRARRVADESLALHPGWTCLLELRAAADQVLRRSAVPDEPAATVPAGVR